MDLNLIFDIASKLTLTASLVFAILALVLGIVVSAKSVKLLMEQRDQREAAVAAERDKREALLVAQIESWRSAAEAAAHQRDEADDRADRLTAAFETAYRILSSRGRIDQIEPPSGL